MAVEFGKWEKIERERIVPFTVKENVMIRGWWSADKEGKKVIDKAFLEDTVYFHIEMMGIPIQDGEKLSLQLYDYDHFLWFDIYNLDDKIENPRECILKNGKALLEVYLKPQWKEHIDKDLGSSIELYWKVKYIKKDKRELTINLPKEERDYLKVSNNRDIYIIPAYPEKEYYFPEIYSFSGEMLVFTDVLKDWGEGYVGEKISKAIQKWALKRTEVIVLAKLEKGQLGTNFKNVIQGAHKRRIEITEQLSDGRTATYYRAPNKGTGIEGETTKGILQYSFFEKKGKRVKGLYLLRKGLGTFEDMKDLLNFAKDGDINEATENILMILIKESHPLLGLFVSVGNQILMTPAKQFIEDWKEEEIKALLLFRYNGILKLQERVTIYNKEKIRSNPPYYLDEISTEVMEALLEGKIKNRNDLASYRKRYPCKFVDTIIDKVHRKMSEVYMLYKEEANGMMVINSFL